MKLNTFVCQSYNTIGTKKNINTIPEWQCFKLQFPLADKKPQKLRKRFTFKFLGPFQFLFCSLLIFMDF